MCTISYIPISDKGHSFVVTDNRDESVNRPAELPKTYQENNTMLFYPKDIRAGGTWMGVSGHNSLICLMNGAFHRHKRETAYRKSRGILVKDLLGAKSPLSVIRSYDLNGIEPFFALLFLWENEIKVYEMIWDGLKVHLDKKDSNQPAIWSAAMTYSEKQRKKREMKFKVFLDTHQNSETLPRLVWDFHHLKGNKMYEGLIINRGELRTTSISQFFHLGDGRGYFRFENIITGEQHQSEISALF